MNGEKEMAAAQAAQARAEMEACQRRIEELQEQIRLEKKSLKYWGNQMNKWSAEAAK